MSAIHPNSNSCVNSELNLFELPMTQTGVISGEWVEFSPISSISNNSSMTFLVSGNSETYIDISKTLLQLQVEIRKLDGSLPKAAVLAVDGSVITPADVIAPTNLFLHSIFPEVHLYMNEKSVTPSAQNYPYKSMIQTLLTYGDPAKESYLTSSLYYRDTARYFDDFPNNKGFQKRAGFARNGVIDMIGGLHLDICNQPRYLLNLIDLKFIFGKPNIDFCLHGTEPCKIDIKSASLFIRKIKLINEIPLAHAKVLQVARAKYPCNRTECTSFSIPKGNMSVVQDHLFTGAIPRKLVLGLVKQTAFLGELKTNPYNFQHFDLNHIGLFVDGSSVPHKPLTPNYAENSYIQAFYNLTLMTGQFQLDEGNQISREEYPLGNCLYCYDLTPDLVSNASHFHLIKNGNLRLELKFAKALPETIAVVLYAEFQSLVEVDRNRSVTIE